MDLSFCSSEFTPFVLTSIVFSAVRMENGNSDKLKPELSFSSKISTLFKVKQLFSISEDNNVANGKRLIWITLYTERDDAQFIDTVISNIRKRSK